MFVSKKSGEFYSQACHQKLQINGRIRVFSQPRMPQVILLLDIRGGKGDQGGGNAEERAHILWEH